MISNVSLHTMELIVDGVPQKAIQIGTVMTDPAHRRQGLAYQLLQKILVDYDSLYDLYFLAADPAATPLYEKCGFVPRTENQYVVDLTGYERISVPLQPVIVPPEKLLEMKKQAHPLSRILSARGDEHIFMFYYTLGYKNSIYQPQEDVYTIFEITGDTLHLYDILSPRKVVLGELISQIAPQNVQQVLCHFTPDQPLQNLTVSMDPSSSWMLRTTSGKGFPPLARFPKISQA